MGPKSIHTAVRYDKILLSDPLWTKSCNGNGKYRPELSGNVQMYQWYLYFAMFCAISALGIVWQHLNDPN